MASEVTAKCKVLVNDTNDVVTEAIEGFLLAHPHLTRLDGFPDIKVVLRADWDKSKVALISGGGSGHEPSHAGFVSGGMLTAAVAGNVFASPSISAILAAIHAVAGPKGVLLIVKNYTGDRLNFGLAAEEARSAGIDVRVVFVADDASLNTGKVTGRRGVAGVVFVHKIAGAVAEAGGSLEEVAEAAQAAADSVSSYGVALSVCSVPGQTRSDRLDGDTIEFGLGIHGEPGASRSPLLSADEVANKLVSSILDGPAPSDGHGAAIRRASRMAVLVNNLGASSGIEVAIMTRRIVHILRERSIVVERLYTGALMTALDMHGVSCSLIPVDDDRLHQLDFAVSAPGWPCARASGLPCPASAPMPLPVPSVVQAADDQEASDIALGTQSRQLASVVLAGCDAVMAVVDKLTELDTAVGDGDCGTTFQRGAERVAALITARTSGQAGMHLASPSAFFRSLGRCLRTSMGGTSGVILDIMCTAASTELGKLPPGHQWEPVSISNAFQVAVAAATRYGNARPGDCTMIDALHPASEAAAVAAAAPDATASSVAAAAASAAAAGAEATAEMRAAAGRASYVEESVTIGVQDAGAVAVSAILSGIAKGLA